jgi:hypothetical protein
MSLLPPPEAVQYSDRKALVDALQAHAATNGYAITIQRSNAKDGVIYFRCDRGGQYRARYSINDTNRLRNTGTRLVDCPFSIRANLKDGIWSMKVRNPDHNHEATTTAVSHPIQHRLTSAIKQQIRELSTSGIASQGIISTIRQSTNHAIFAADIYNICKKIRLENLAGKTPMESLIAILESSNYTFKYRIDDTRRVTHLFFTHLQSIEIFH